MTVEIKGHWVNSVLKATIQCHPHAPVQMTVLTRALVLAAKTLGIQKGELLDAVGKAYDVEKPLARLQS